MTWVRCTASWGVTCRPLRLAALVLAATRADAAVVVIARPGPAGPAAAIAGEQIAHWTTREPVVVVDDDPPSPSPDVSLVVELTEDFDFRAEMPMSNGATIRVSSPRDLASPTRRLADAAAAAINASITVPSERFVVEEAPPDEGTAPPRITIVTSTKTELDRQRLAKRTRQHRVGVHALLASAGVIDPAVVTPESIAPAARPGVARVAIYDDLGARNRTAACNPAWIRESMRHLGDLDVSLVSAADIRAGALPGQFDVLVVGGGSSKTEGRTIGDDGKQAITRFVSGGGGYVGICAGAFLASRTSYGLGISPTQVRSTRAGGLARVDLAEPFRKAAGLPPGVARIAFHGGPILALADDATTRDALVWGTFRTDVEIEPNPAAAATTKEQDLPTTIPLAGTPAVVSATYGSGRVVVFSPHPERAPGPQTLFWTAVRFAAGRTQTELLHTVGDEGVSRIEPVPVP
ncbi:MAG: BPL-N domain-containing protein [Pirellulales bacterium]